MVRTIIFKSTVQGKRPMASSISSMVEAVTCPHEFEYSACPASAAQKTKTLALIAAPEETVRIKSEFRRRLASSGGANRPPSPFGHTPLRLPGIGRVMLRRTVRRPRLFGRPSPCRPPGKQTGNGLRPISAITKIFDFRGFDCSIILILWGGIHMPTGNFLEMLSQQILAEIINLREIGRTVQ